MTECSVRYDTEDVPPKGSVQARIYVYIHFLCYYALFRI